MNLASSESYDIRPYLEKFLASADVSDIDLSIDSPVFDRTSGFDPNMSRGMIDFLSNRSAIFEFELAAFDALQVLPEANRLGHKELLNWILIIYERNKSDDACRTSINNELKKVLRPEDTEIAPVLEHFLGMEYIHNIANDTDDIIINIMHDPNLIPYIREAIDKTPNNSDTVSLIEALYACGSEEEAVNKALEILALPIRQEKTYDLFVDMYRNADLLLFLGKTQRDDLIPVIDGYTQQDYFEHYMEVYSHLDDSVISYYRLIDFRQKAIMALARLGGQSVIPRLKQLYDSPVGRIRIVSALALYYNGDTIGEELLHHFVDGTYNEKDAFQDVISSYLRNDLTDALWLEKLTYNIDIMSDRDIAETGFFKDNRSEILSILVEQLNNKRRSIRGFALEILRQATGQNFGFDPAKYHVLQEEIIQQWRNYIAHEY